MKERRKEKSFMDQKKKRSELCIESRPCEWRRLREVLIGGIEEKTSHLHLQSTIYQQTQQYISQINNIIQLQTKAITSFVSFNFITESLFLIQLHHSPLTLQLRPYNYPISQPKRKGLPNYLIRIQLILTTTAHESSCNLIHVWKN